MVKRVRVCFKCKKYLPVIEGNAENIQRIDHFNSAHHKHPVQTIPKSELPHTFKMYIIPMSEGKARCWF